MKKLIFALIFFLIFQGFSEEIKISRSVVIQLNQTLDVVYPGSGWIFLGEFSENRILRMIDRKTGSHATNFSFRADSVGKTVIRFYRQDFLKQQFLNDALEVWVQDFDVISEERVSAPNFFMAETEEPDAEKMDSRPPAIESSIASQEAIDEDGSSELAVNVSSKDVLAETKKLQSGGDIVKAINILDAALPDAKSQLDELMFLRGQLYEAKSILQNIRRALESYEEVVNSHPASPLYEVAAERARYIKNYYFDIQ